MERLRLGDRIGFPNEPCCDVSEGRNDVDVSDMSSSATKELKDRQLDQSSDILEQKIGTYVVFRAPITYCGPTAERRGSENSRM